MSYKMHFSGHKLYGVVLGKTSTWVKLLIGSEVPCVFCFEICTQEGRGEKGGRANFKTKYTAPFRREITSPCTWVRHKRKRWNCRWRQGRRTLSPILLRLAIWKLDREGKKTTKTKTPFPFPAVERIRKFGKGSDIQASVATATLNCLWVSPYKYTRSCPFKFFFRFIECKFGRKQGR